jgi:hypothetical protein
MPPKETPVPTNFHTALGLLNNLCNSAEVSDLVKRLPTRLQALLYGLYYSMKHTGLV